MPLERSNVPTFQRSEIALGRMNDGIEYFRRRCQVLFHFLVADYGYEQPVFGDSPWSLFVIYKSARTAVEVRYDLRDELILVSLVRLVDGKIPGYGKDAYSRPLLGNILPRRCPGAIVHQSELPRSYPLPVIEAILRQDAQALSTYARDILQGDYSLFVEVAEDSQRLYARSRSLEEEARSAGEFVLNIFFLSSGGPQDESTVCMSTTDGGVTLRIMGSDLRVVRVRLPESKWRELMKAIGLVRAIAEMSDEPLTRLYEVQAVGEGTIALAASGGRVDLDLVGWDGQAVTVRMSLRELRTLRAGIGAALPPTVLRLLKPLPRAVGKMLWR